MHGRSTAQYRCRGEAGRMVVIDDVPATLVWCDDESCEVRVCGEVDARVREQAKALLFALEPGREGRAVYGQPSQAKDEKATVKGV